MSRRTIHVIITLALSALAIWLFMGYILPIGLPFLFGFLLALTAEPAVNLLSKRLHLPRSGASCLAVTAVFCLATTILSFLLGLLVRQSQQLAHALPQLIDTITQITDRLQEKLAALSQRLPPSIHNLTGQFLENLPNHSSALLEQTVTQLPKLATGVLAAISNGMLGLITGIISAYMLSGRMPALARWWQTHQPEHWQTKWSPALKNLQKALKGWLLAEIKLTAIAFVLMLMGVWILGIKNPLASAAWITLVDAFPILGVGAILLPWSLICMLRQQTARGFGLLAVYIIVWLIRSVMEPKLVGKGMGLDPLVTLVSIYAGWKLWGLLGMLLAPILALTVTQIQNQLER